MGCVPLTPRGRGQRKALDALEALVRYYRANTHRMKYRLYRGQGRQWRGAERPPPRPPSSRPG